jgi:hypothetical protein
MNITIDNYEAFLLDFIEKRLDAESTKALRNFIAQHPELGSWEDLTESLPELETQAISYPYAESLLKPEIVAYGGIDEHNYMEYFTAWHENVLNAAEKASTIHFIRLNPALEADFRLAGMVYLEPDATILYPDKELLLKNAPVVSMLTSKTLWVAATIALLLTVVGIWWFKQMPEQEKIQQAFDPAIEAVSVEMTKSQLPHTTTVVDKDETNMAWEHERQALAESKPENMSRTPQQRYETLPSLQKIAVDGIIIYSSGSLALVDDDLESRLLLAMLIEGNQNNKTGELKLRISQAVVGLGKTINFIQRSPQRIMPENLLSAGVAFYNILTDNNVALVKEYEAGQLQAIMLESDRLGLRKTMP